VNTQVLNPKSITMGELYGEVDKYTQEWVDGLASSIIRDCNIPKAGHEQDRYWIVFDGPVDALWIENMNTVLDDNMTLCLANGERVKLRNELRMLFEVQDLAVASPATVSRCGMVYLSNEDLPWQAYVKSWIVEKYPDGKILNEDAKNLLLNMMELVIPQSLIKFRKSFSEPFPTVDIQLVTSVCNILEKFIAPDSGFKLKDNMEENKKRIAYIFAFAFIWGLTASFDNSELSKVKIIYIYFSIVKPYKGTYSRFCRKVLFLQKQGTVPTLNRSSDTHLVLSIVSGQGPHA
jgi:dynein heavy chain, axonemal